MKSDLGKAYLTDDLIREAVKLELDSVDVPLPSEAWKRIEAELAQPRVTSAKRPFLWSTLAAAAAVFLVLAIGGLGLFRSVQLDISVADSEVPPAADLEVPRAAGEEIAMLQVEQVEDEIADDFIGVMDENGSKVIDEPPVMIAEAESEPESEAWPPLLAEEYFLFNTVILDSEDHSAFSGAFYRGSDVELLFVKDVSPEMPVISFIDLLGIRIGAELEVIDQSDDYVYFETLKMPGLAWQNESQNQALMVVSGSLDASILKDIASGLK